jgi:hypothetical protein
MDIFRKINKIIYSEIEIMGVDQLIVFFFHSI